VKKGNRRKGVWGKENADPHKPPIEKEKSRRSTGARQLGPTRKTPEKETKGEKRWWSRLCKASHITVNVNLGKK